MENNLIYINIQIEEGTFYYSLSELGKFRGDQFQSLMNYIYELHHTIDDSSRLKQAIILWELALFWEQRKANHYDVNDAFEIENLDDDKIRQLSQIFYYACNWFSYGKDMKKEYLDFGKW